MRIERDMKRCGCRTSKRPRDDVGGTRFSGRTAESTGRSWLEIVFGREPEAGRERKYLEQLTHPEIGRLLKRQAEAFEAAGVKVAVLDAALLFEAGWNEMCEKTVFVESPREVRLARALARGWTEEDFAAREGVQDSLDRKRPRADVIIDNSGSAERTQAQVEQFWASLFR